MRINGHRGRAYDCRGKEKREQIVKEYIRKL